jgi:hypothetical protein
MGYNLYRLETIKNRFVQSSDQELNNLFTFLHEQVDKSVDEHESKYSVIFDRTSFERLKSKPSQITPVELELILEFVEERIDINRNSDRGDKILGKLDMDTYYAHEERYTAIEKYVLKLTIG